MKRMEKKYLLRKNELELLFSYCNKVGIDVNEEDISEKLGEKLFSTILIDFKNGILSTDELSALCELMYGKFSPVSDIYALLLNGAEMEWNLRNNPHSAADAISELLEAFL